MTADCVSLRQRAFHKTFNSRTGCHFIRLSDDLVKFGFVSKEILLLIRKATRLDIPRIMEIRAGVRENKHSL
jgi:hypothetical protein